MRRTLAAAIIMLSAACRTTTGASVKDEAAVAVASEPAGLKQCVAIHGNGQKIFIHFTALAHLVETFGLMDGVSGGSSASITSFLYESMATNPLVWSCGGATCSQKDAAERVALLLKSLHGFTLEAGDRSLPLALAKLGDTVKQLHLDDPKMSLRALAGALKTVRSGLKDLALVDLFNPKVFLRLETAIANRDLGGARKAAHDIGSAVTKFGRFNVSEPGALLRDGLVNFDSVAAHLGPIADFYAGRFSAPAYGEAFSNFLTSCAPLQHGKYCNEIAAAAAGGATCKDLFARVLDAAADQTAARPRIDDDTKPMAAKGVDGEDVFSVTPLLVTSLLHGNDVVGSVDAARQTYLQTGVEKLDVPFSAVGFGFWGDEAFFRRAVANKQPQDTRLQRARWLGDGPWRNVLSTSPAEPGMSTGRPLPPDRETGEALLSVGGWADMYPSVPLRRGGCDRVFLITRPGKPTFPVQVVKLLGASESQAAQLFDPTAAGGTAHDAILETDAAVCFEFDDPKYDQAKLDDLLRMGDDAYRAGLALGGPSPERTAALAAEAGAWPRIDVPTPGCRAR
jgi:hypothetical protein